MPKYRMTVEYEGTRYRGWQIQRQARTVQGELLMAAREALRDSRADVQGAGRTDAGVHALGQSAHIETSSMYRGNLVHALNDLLPHDINVLNAERVEETFHARHDAVMRSYLYLIARRRSAFGKRFAWWVRDDLDPSPMSHALGFLKGRHDFTSFTDRHLEISNSTTVEIESAELLIRRDVLLLRLTASHFLWKMVRRIVGTLVEVGRGHLSPNDITVLLTEPGDEPAQWTAPPSGLFLERVLYRGEELPPLSLPTFPFLLPDDMDSGVGL